MAKLYFRHSTMNAGKSIDILKIHHNYQEQGKECLLFSSVLDNRFGSGVIASRIGLKEEATMIHQDSNVYELLLKEITPNTHCILIDEGQFLSSKQVDDLSKIVDNFDIPIIVYGLLTDFQSNLFEGSKRLIELADRIEQLKTVCWYCDKKANFNMRVVNGQAVYEGNQIEIGDNADKAKEDEIAYLPVCRKHYFQNKPGY